MNELIPKDQRKDFANVHLSSLRKHQGIAVTSGAIAICALPYIEECMEKITHGPITTI